MVKNMPAYCKEFSLQEVCDFLKSHNDYLILTHASPDGDTLGSGFALMQILIALGKNAKVLCPDGIPPKFEFLVKTPVVDFKEQTIIAVDIADPKLLGMACEQYEDKVELCIDHHVSNIKYSKSLFLDSTSAAACEIIYTIAIALGVEINKDIANALYTGIATDTGCFKYSNTTAKTHSITAKLFEAQIDATEINRAMFETISCARLEIERMALETIDFRFNGKCAIISITADMIEKTKCDKSDLEGVTAMARTIEGVVVGVTLRENQRGKVKVSVRTHDPIDACAICSNLGGGGHPRASGCEIVGDIEHAKQEIIRYVGLALKY